jgi:hypothetical protein
MGWGRVDKCGYLVCRHSKAMYVVGEVDKRDRHMVVGLREEGGA